MTPMPASPMSDFPATATAYWNTLFRSADTACSVIVDPALQHERRIMLLQTVDRRARVVVTPAMADRLSLLPQPCAAPATNRNTAVSRAMPLHWRWRPRRGCACSAAGM